jgi:hypothetical protein
MDESCAKLLLSCRLACVLGLAAEPVALGQSNDLVKGIALGGSIDVYYGANFSSPASRMNKLRNFDIPANQVNLSLAEISLQKKAEPIGFRLVAGFGTASDVVHGIAPYGTSEYSALTNIQQAYLTAVVPVGNGLTVDAGEFVTHIGNETIESSDNWNYSRSLLFAWAIPYFHTGLRVSYPIASTLSVTAHVVNGWNSVLDNNSEKSAGLTVNWMPTSSTGIIFNVIDGFEQPTGLGAGKKTVFDLVLSQRVVQAVGLVLNADFGRERLVSGLQTWMGIALYGRYVLDSKSTVGIRGEIFRDPEGYATGLGIPNLEVREVTGTYEYRFADVLVLRGEGRYDIANVPLFDRRASVNAEKGQFTLLMGLVAVF